eukprot:CAMPEP_0206060558 /NCGR_PEP_ID=MMETSP1466-20131121/51569_1 /ASSEMBLY_ACC=CAM_ASM_001126 /TAXON_ID=44452 /ORGANISM="Pavlova gyrans, Strain CCMP608" /LENGTH=45 /DNA_ID= /DNA_START= /DNA_END= /DNA_ORIENTATION=
MADDPYATLGIHPRATAEHIRQAYLKKCLALHPDKGGNDAEAFAR